MKTTKPDAGHGGRRASRVSIFAALGLGALIWAEAGRTESPLSDTVNDVRGGPAVQKRDAEVIPLLWRARVGAAVASIPLGSIEHYGIQDYNLDGHARIRELTVTTESRSMVRIYHILPLGALHEDAAKRLEDMRRKAEGLVGEFRSQDDDLPIKSYPTTTHEKMVEYRVSRLEDIDLLFASLDAAMVTYLGRELVPAQREMVVEAVSVTKAQ